MNARSALLFYQFSQSMARWEQSDNPTSDIWLCSFRLELQHLATLKADGTLGFWNRLYVDHLFTTFDLKLTKDEWSTFRCWTFEAKTGRLVDDLNFEMLSHSNPALTRLYHCIVPTDFYNEHFLENTPSDWEVISLECSDFGTQTATLQTLNFEGDVSSTHSMGTLGSQDSTGTVLADEVIITSGGTKFHFLESCIGLENRKHPIRVITFQEAKMKGRTLCSHCEQLKTFRTPLCSTLGCSLATTWEPHFCCRQCVEKKGHGRFCAQSTSVIGGTSASSS